MKSTIYDLDNLSFSEYVVSLHVVLVIFRKRVSIGGGTLSQFKL